MASRTQDDDFQMKPEDLDRIKTAMKDKEFRDLLVEYANEISNPENKKKYEEEIIALEKQRGQDVKLIKPQSGFVLKTRSCDEQSTKTFFNICTSPEVGRYSTEKGVREGVKGVNVKLPHSIVAGREDIDKAGNPCAVFDICFHPETYERAVEEERFRQLLIDTSFDAIEKQTGKTFNRKEVKFPKMKYKGTPQSSILRSNPLEKNATPDSVSKEASSTDFQYPNTVEDKTSKSHQTDQTIKSQKPEEPPYKVTQRGYFDMQDFTSTTCSVTSTHPKELYVEINLPLVKSAADLDVDIFEKELKLVCENPSYKLTVPLSYRVDEDLGKAQFDKSKHKLNITLPVLKPQLPKQDSNINLENGNEENAIENVLNGSKEDNIEKTSLLNGENTYKSKMSDISSESNEMFSDRTDENGVCSNSLKSDDDISSENSAINNESCSADVSKNVSDSDNETANETIEDKSNEQKEETLDESGFAEPIDFENVQFDTSILESLPGYSKLPPYCYHQTEETIVISIKLPVKVENLSIGFTEHQVYVSFPQDPTDPLSCDWNMIVRTEDHNFLQRGLCAFDVNAEGLEVSLHKHTAGLWDRMFIGVSERELKAEFFLTDNTTLDLPKAPQSKNEESNHVNLERRLEQLLKEQDNSGGVEISLDKKFVTEDEPRVPTNTPAKPIERLTSTEPSDTEDCEHIDLMDLQDDVIESEGTSHNDYQLMQKRKQRLFYERSISHDGAAAFPKSILKRSKSEGATYDTDDETLDSCLRSVTVSGYNQTYARRRYKSVTFLEKPIVFEFDKLSKRQWKKKIKQEKEREAHEAKHADKIKNKPPLPPQNSEQEQQKSGRKWRKAEKKRLRQSSESRSEEETDVTANDKKGKKNKGKKKNKHLSNGKESSGSEEENKVKLKNELIFQLD